MVKSSDRTTGRNLTTIKQVLRRLRFQHWYGGVISPFGFIDGRWNLQGFPFPQDISLTKIKFTDVDLTKAYLVGARLTRCTFDNTLFVQTDCTGLSDYACRFTNCRFIGTKFDYASIGLHMSKFQGCLFERAHFHKTGIDSPEFDDCTFIDCHWGDYLDFDGSPFRNCRFIGKLSGLFFRGKYACKEERTRKRYARFQKNRMENVDFSLATLYDVSFTHECDLSTVRLAMDGHQRRYDNWPARLERAAQRAASYSTAERQQLEEIIKLHLGHAPQSCFIIEKDCWMQEHYSDAIIDTFFELLED